MKIARLDQLPREDNLFTDKEPEVRYKRRQINMVADGYDFSGNNATDISLIKDWLFYHARFLISRQDAIINATAMVVTWSTHDQSEKDLILDFAANTASPVLSADQMADIQSIVGAGFTVFENGGVNVQKVWNGIDTWQ